MPSKEKKHYVAGIDEAGYGPLLGPLVIASVVFETPRPGESLWDSLRGAVSRRARRSGGVQIADSKKVYTPSAGLGRLERGVLSSLVAGGIAGMGPFDAVLGRIAHHFDEPSRQMSGQPWYKDLALPLPLAADAEEVSRAAEKMRSAMAGAGIALCDVCVNPLHPPRLNLLIGERGNKATVLFEETAALIRRLLHLYGRRGIRIVADRQGMRRYYEPLLCQAFPMSRIGVIREEKRHSEYEICVGEGAARLAFIEKADDAHLPVALASMTAKYVREVFMSAFNAYWRERVPGLKPTAGYPSDARRFLAEIESVWNTAGISRGAVVRAK